MTGYVCSIGEPTTGVCAQQLQKFGYKVIILDEKESWPEKYKRFIDDAFGNQYEFVLRVDADVIINAKMLFFNHTLYNDMTQFHGYDFYKNDIGIMSPVIYSKRAIEFIKRNFNKLDLRRPEASAWRLLEKNKGEVHTSEQVVGSHGLYQRPEDIKRHKQHKIDRKQIEDYDFDLVESLDKLRGEK